MQKILEFFVDNARSIQSRRIYEYLDIRSHAKFGDHLFLLLGTFLVYYLFCFRLRLHFEYGTISKKSVKKLKKHNYKQKEVSNKEPTFFRWLYMFDSHSFDVYKLKHPKLAKICFIYNAITVSVYICGTILIIPSLFNKIIRNIFIDIVFLHIYINVIPMGIYNLIRFLYQKAGTHNND